MTPNLFFFTSNMVKILKVWGHLSLTLIALKGLIRTKIKALTHYHKGEDSRTSMDNMFRISGKTLPLEVHKSLLEQPKIYSTMG